jgi:hypothetical protein
MNTHHCFREKRRQSAALAATRLIACVLSLSAALVGCGGAELSATDPVGDATPTGAVSKPITPPVAVAGTRYDANPVSNVPTVAAKIVAVEPAPLRPDAYANP